MSQRIVKVQVKDERIIGDGISIGAAGSHCDVLIEFDFRGSDVWKDTTKRVVFRDALGESTYTVVLTSVLKEKDDLYLVPVPYSIKKYAGEIVAVAQGVIVSGTTETLKVTTENAVFRVLPSDIVPSNETPTASQIEQIQAGIDDLAEKTIVFLEKKAVQSVQRLVLDDDALTYAEVKELATTRPCIVVDQGYGTTGTKNYYYPQKIYEPSETQKTITFVTVSGNEQFITCDQDGKCTSSLVELQTKGNLSQSLDTTTYQYPSNNAVKTYVDSADATLLASISAEATARASADTTLENNLKLITMKLVAEGNSYAIYLNGSKLTFSEVKNLVDTRTCELLDETALPGMNRIFTPVLSYSGAVRFSMTIGQGCYRIDINSNGTVTKSEYNIQTVENRSSSIDSSVTNYPNNNAVKSYVDGLINTEKTAREAADTLEVSNRNAAISSMMSVEVDSRNTAISNAISTEVTNRNNAINSAISTEVSNRNSAVAAEKSARESADATLTSSLASEVSARQSADATLTSSLTVLKAEYTSLKLYRDSEGYLCERE